ncbi:unnamed protein product [Chrysodeixis includens]|uniref:Uncharacterized protein n=1 Tax=Chrysodeixis includens TaxID=689277 RepID=A0A9P0BZR2_CHRIL|nr:unnamed protein product [Chrysodeixis includens]
MSRYFYFGIFCSTFYLNNSYVYKYTLSQKPYREESSKTLCIIKKKNTINKNWSAKKRKCLCALKIHFTFSFPFTPQGDVNQMF